MRTGIFYATNTGYTEDVAEEIKRQLGSEMVDEFENVEDMDVHKLEGFDVLIIGIATWDAGDLPYDWALLHDRLDECDFTGTRIALFGLGDQWGYPETFLDAMGILYRKLLERGAMGEIGFWPIRDYEFSGSLAQYGDQFCGLAIDQDNEAELTSGRIVEWCAQIKRELRVFSVCPPAPGVEPTIHTSVQS